MRSAICIDLTEHTLLCVALLFFFFIFHVSPLLPLKCLFAEFASGSRNFHFKQILASLCPKILFLWQKTTALDITEEGLKVHN